MPAGPDKHSKTEKATPKRKREARKKGQVAKSAELSGWVTLLVGSMILPIYFQSAENRLLGLTTAAVGVASEPTVPGALAVLGDGLSDMLIIVFPVLVLMMILGVAANIAQVGLKFGGGAMAPKLSKLSPLKGFKRIVSPQGLWMLGKELLKLTVVGILGYESFMTLWHTFGGAQPANITPMVDFTGASLLHLVRIVAFAGLVLALLDYAYQRHSFNKQQKMTKEEVRRETKDHQGNPLHKGEQKRRAMRLHRLRMLNAIAQADLVVTNPTHVAVAIRYDKKRSAAPQVVALGADEMAATIRAVATRHNIPIVEDPPLARAIYAACELGDQIPKELYMAVARLLAFVYTLSPQLKELRPIHRRPVSAMFS